MAQDSRRVRRLRRVKRERTQLRQAVGQQQNQMRTVVKMLMDAQAELRALKPEPSVTVRTLADEYAGEPDYAVNTTGTEYPAGPITEEMNRACCIDDSPAS